MRLWRYGRAIERLGQRYRLEGVLGSGGMADVCLAWDEHDEREVAIKVIKPEELDQRSLDRFLKEGAQIARWQHPHILRVYGDVKFEVLDAAQGCLVPYIVMEYAQGGDLHKRLRAGRPYPLTTTLHVFAQICSAVAYAHSQGIIHRDIKPLNVLFRLLPNGKEQALLSDFGLAVEMSATHMTFAGGGTLPYMAPEQLQGHAEPASDIFALGVMLYQLCTGRLPFRRTLQDLRRARPGAPLDPDPTPPGDLNPLLPAALDTVILTALAQDPAARYAGADLLWEHVRAATPTRSSRTVSLRSLPSSGAPTQSSHTAGHHPTGNDVAARRPSNHASPTPPTLTPELPHSAPSATGARSRDTYIPQTLDTDHHQPAPAEPSRRMPTPSPLATASTRRRGPHPWLLIGIGLLLLVTVIGGAGALSLLSPGTGGLLKNITFTGLPATTTITITPDSKRVENSYLIQAVTGTPNANAQQVSLRQLTYTPQTQTRTVQATGRAEVPATTAKGSLTFLNGSASSFTVGTGTTLVGSDGVSVALDRPAVIPSGNPPNLGTITVPAHAAIGGPKGNIAALDINEACCAAGGFIFVKNTAAFTGGQDGKGYTFLQQGDVNGTVNSMQDTLSKQALNNFREQIHPNEQLLSGPSCAAKPSIDQPIGDQGTNVTTATVSVTATCTGLVYDQQGAQNIVGSLLQTQAATSLGSGYKLVGKTVTSTNIQNQGQNSVSLIVKGWGIWAYSFTEAQQNEMKSKIAGTSVSQAQTLLKGMRGVGNVTVQTTGSTLPTDPNQITIVVQPVTGLTGGSTPPAVATPAPGSISPASPNGQVTPIPGNGSVVGTRFTASIESNPV